MIFPILSIVIGSLSLILFFLFRDKIYFLLPKNKKEIIDNYFTLSEIEIDKFVEQYIKIDHIPIHHYLKSTEIERIINILSGVLLELEQLGSLKNLILKRKNKEIERVIYYIEHLEMYRIRYNECYIKYTLLFVQKLNQQFSKPPLNYSQLRAVLLDEKYQLLVAGAGTGKTTTLLSKIIYLIKNNNVKPEEILVLSFTNKSISDIERNIFNTGCILKTFHKFAYDSITSIEKTPPSIYDGTFLYRDIENIINNLRNNPKFENDLISYLIYYSHINLNPTDLDTEDKFQIYQPSLVTELLKDNHSKHSKKALNKIRFKSMQEVMIANYLILNNIEFEYETPYPFQNLDTEYRQYKPDFTIYTANGKIFLEHFALNKYGNCPKFFKRENENYTQANKRYKESITWKRKIHAQYRTTLIESYSYEFEDDVIFRNLEINLKENGVVFNPMSNDEIYDLIVEQNSTLNIFIKSIVSFIQLYKSNLRKLKREDIDKHNKYSNHRLNLYLSLFELIFEAYERHLGYSQELDFNDSISITIEYLSTKALVLNFKYVFIDEFQDIASNTLLLIKSIIESSDATLFCVGDDWQSIYGFNGGDVTLFQNITRWFPELVISTLDTCYRFTNPLLEISSWFIQKNESQFPKQLSYSGKNNCTAISIVESDDINSSLINIFRWIDNNSGNKTISIFVLGRYSFDIDLISSKNGLFTSYNNKEIYYSQGSSHFKAQYSTIHSAKGLEADYVIVLNNLFETYGFPTNIPEDPVLDLIHFEKERIEFAEERRLFYVAITRAKKACFLIAKPQQKSQFIKEIEILENKCSFPLKIDPFLSAKLTHPNIIIYL